MTPTQAMHKLISEDLKEKLRDKSAFVFHKEVSKEMTYPTFKKIFDGIGGDSIPLGKYLAIYRALGEKEINISGDSVRLLVRV